MRFDPVLAEIRFGCGLSPFVPAPESVEALLAGLTAPDVVAERFPVETFEAFLPRVREVGRLRQIRRANRGTAEDDDAREAIQRLNQAARVESFKWMAAHIARRVETTAPLRERMAFFWADHFTATGKDSVLRRASSPYLESAIRPNMTGTFEDLLFEAVTHPLMVHYLDQAFSMGPNSQRAKVKKGRGLNENLAREVLELHTLGVDGPYTQTDVTELAELFTGLTHNFQKQGRAFNPNLSEPGTQTILGKTYGPDGAMRDIRRVLRDLARHPATARHIARKLAVHFVSDTPDPALVDDLTAVYRDTGGELMPLYRALLTHPASWDTDQPNVKQPFDFVTSALRALAVPPEVYLPLPERRFRVLFERPMVGMGHVWDKPDGPDGLPEEDSAWITPQGLAARLQWSMIVPQQLVPDLPDPRDFVRQALGRRATATLEFAAAAAESRADGIGIVLASPAFQRM
ncbi:MAG: DUF1800 domain-containing protein [Paracoccaceae bacterium]|nr:DUF1800 domain-containing protein [Paracoccaceae bacterium]